MATVTRENIGTLHDKITVKLEKQDYLPAFEKTLKEYAKKANIPGFRKGMVPAGLVRKMYGQSLLTDEVVKLAGKELEDYMKNAHLSIFAQPMMSADQKLQFDVNNLVEYDFNFEIGLKPDFEIDAVKNKANITRYKIDITDKMLDDEIDRIKKQHGTEQPQELVSAAENIVDFILHPCDTSGNITDAENKKSCSSELGKLPMKLQELLSSKKVGDSIIIQPVNVCTAEELNGFLKNTLLDDTAVENYFLLTIEKISLVIPLETGVELYEKIYPNQPIADETEFRNKIKAELVVEFGRLTSERLQNEIFELLVHNTAIQLPDQFLKRYMREGTETPKTTEVVEKEYPGFEHSLRWQLISDKLISDFGIRVSKDEVVDAIMAKVLSYFGAANAEHLPWLDGYKEKITKDQKTMDETYNQLMISKLFAILETAFTLEEKIINEEDFFKLGDSHSAHHHH